LSKEGRIPLRKVGSKLCVVIAELEAMIAKEKATSDAVDVDRSEIMAE
jgi:hypothetical protein